MDFVLALHSHLPYVLNHGRWPHGSDWLCEAALDTYLPLLEQLDALAAEGTPAPVTIGFTPVLANQLVSPTFQRELEAFFAQRIGACDEAPASLATTGDQPLLPLVRFWRERLERLQKKFRAIDGNLVAAFRRLQEQGRLEIIGSAATHGYLPLLARDESIRLQLAVGRDEHRRLFGAPAAGCWLPECAYRGSVKRRPGIEQHLARAGFRYFFTDAHLARAGTPLGAYEDIPLGAERFDAERHDDPRAPGRRRPLHSPYQAYRVSKRAKGAGVVAALVRDPRSSMQVWSRHQGYPGDASYLEFHKIRWPGGLKLWRVTGADVDLGAKRPYDPAAALGRVRDHAGHFVGLLDQIGSEHAKEKGGVIVAPFDTELYGHWWFEGPDFLADTYRGLKGRAGVHAVTGSGHLAAHPPRTALQLAEGSWGANGDHSMWLNPGTKWTWTRLHRFEQSFWDAAPEALRSEAARPILAQAARELLLAQASDWQFIISTGAVVDYAERRFTQHCDDGEGLLQALGGDAARLASARVTALALGRRDDLFPDVLAQVAEALAG
ncbi:MAG TPA: 1,4-alpha-glucan branching protein domain-containing protein [Gemmatimonadales bacterium]|nr:1,4-alpha-glucan branching protein domain-containing protein [Gemmatimonadales bacterium]HZH41858.1 1,4-alpha-glucan branching protein domain-containing protein [Gemmatimonadales bacterium]